MAAGHSRLTTPEVSGRQVSPMSRHEDGARPNDRIHLIHQPTRRVPCRAGCCRAAKTPRGGPGQVAPSRKSWRSSPRRGHPATPSPPLTSSSSRTPGCRSPPRRSVRLYMPGRPWAAPSRSFVIRSAPRAAGAAAPMAAPLPSRARYAAGRGAEPRVRRQAGHGGRGIAPAAGRREAPGRAATLLPGMRAPAARGAPSRRAGAGSRSEPGHTQRPSHSPAGTRRPSHAETPAPHTRTRGHTRPPPSPRGRLLRRPSQGDGGGWGPDLAQRPALSLQNQARSPLAQMKVVVRPGLIQPKCTEWLGWEGTSRITGPCHEGRGVVKCAVTLWCTIML